MVFSDFHSKHMRAKKKKEEEGGKKRHEERIVRWGTQDDFWDPSFVLVVEVLLRRQK